MANVVLEEATELALMAARRRDALTVEQRERRELVAARQAVIQAGVRAPASGVFGRVGKG